MANGLIKLLSYDKNYRITESMSSPIFSLSEAFRFAAAVVCVTLLAACASPDRIVAQGVKDWCERDVHCGRTSSDPSQVQTGAPPSRNNPSGAPR